jgi:hypothetical protein
MCIAGHSLYSRKNYGGFGSCEGGNNNNYSTELMHENTITVPTPVLFIARKSGFLCTFESTRLETPL